MSISPKEAEVERAKSQLKASLLLSLDGTSAIAEDIGRQVVTSGRRFTPKQIENAIEAVTVDEIKRVAQKYLWDKDVSRDFSDHNSLLTVLLVCPRSIRKGRRSLGLPEDQSGHVQHDVLIDWRMYEARVYCLLDLSLLFLFDPANVISYSQTSRPYLYSCFSYCWSCNTHASSIRRRKSPRPFAHSCRSNGDDAPSRPWVRLSPLSQEQILISITVQM